MLERANWLTVTKVVFELDIVICLKYPGGRLTVTKVVFEYFVIFL